MLERRVRRSDRAYAAAQLYLESCARRHGCRALVLATHEGFAVAGIGSEEELTVIGAIATSAQRSAAHGVRRLSLRVGDARFCVGALGFVPEAECVESLARILAS